ncbi:hypothetical protein SAMN05444397_11248 [Flavobacterium aquidurense]|uniref:Uncharacterized protein n=1 Tax=Flavobacterium frigidimaris TaxID=262320 RepID=A0ABX4BKQ0_FLAFR|nr:hypothetical protein [Flavobacterium frigidimaris]OXA75744.1 hypothetical protein B0A65_21255 [Flavobacterium frigidimaris]SDZ63856.1 hypothetical protein SAMN05444397_11248 [Flavobacterium aquidurense]
MNTFNHRSSRSDNEAINSETMENKDPAINQHQNNYENREPYNNDVSDGQNLDDNDDINLQKNSNRTIDAERDLSNHNDPDRRTLDEYSANKAEPDDNDGEEE